MNRTSIPTLVGVFTSLLAIWLLHNILVVDDCTRQNGEFNYNTSQCILGDGEIYQHAMANAIIVLYFFVGFIVSFIVSTLIKKCLIKKSNT